MLCQAKSETSAFTFYTGFFSPPPTTHDTQEFVGKTCAVISIVCLARSDPKQIVCAEQGWLIHQQSGQLGNSWLQYVIHQRTQWWGFLLNSPSSFSQSRQNSWCWWIPKSSFKILLLQGISRQVQTVTIFMQETPIGNHIFEKKWGFRIRCSFFLSHCCSVSTPECVGAFKLQTWVQFLALRLAACGFEPVSGGRQACIPSPHKGTLCPFWSCEDWHEIKGLGHSDGHYGRDHHSCCEKHVLQLSVRSKLRGSILFWVERKERDSF